MKDYRMPYLNNSSKVDYKNFINYHASTQFNNAYNEIIKTSFSNPHLRDYSEEAIKSPSLNYMKRLPPMTKQESRYKFIN